MKLASILLSLSVLASCTTIHFRSNHSVPVSFDGNPEHQKEVSILSKRDFYWWGADPDHHTVFIDEEIRKAGYDGISKLVIYEQKSPQENLISFLTLGIYMPRSYTITGFTTGKMLPND